MDDKQLLNRVVNVCLFFEQKVFLWKEYPKLPEMKSDAIEAFKDNWPRCKEILYAFLDRFPCVDRRLRGFIEQFVELADSEDGFEQITRELQIPHPVTLNTVMPFNPADICSLGPRLENEAVLFRPLSSISSEDDRAVQKISNSRLQALRSHTFAEQVHQRELTVRESHTWLMDNLDNEEAELPEDYSVPKSLRTFQNYISEARKALGEPKYQKGQLAESRSVARLCRLDSGRGRE